MEISNIAITNIGIRKIRVSFKCKGNISFLERNRIRLRENEITSEIIKGMGFIIIIIIIIII